MIDIKKLIEIAHKAGAAIQPFYGETIEVIEKSDHSPLTQADLASHAVIVQELNQYYPDIPVLSEENAEQDHYEKRKSWSSFFLVDPLDGTKEFIKRNGEFTVNIALISQHEPVMGVIYAPILNTTYFAEKNAGAFKLDGVKTLRLTSSTPHQKNIRVVASRSHYCDQTHHFIENLKAEGKEVSLLSAGSALKFGLVAEGKADIYPRFSPTMEWDTAAGQILVTEAGKEMRCVLRGNCVTYNKEELRNNGFIVK